MTRRNFIHLNKFLKQKRIRRDTKEKIQIRNEKNNNFLQNQGILKLPQKKLNNNLVFCFNFRFLIYKKKEKNKSLNLIFISGFKFTLRTM